MVVAYDSNYIRVFDLLNKCLHPWSRTNGTRFPSNFLSRYNRLLGATSLSESKFLMYSNYTYTILDINQGLPSEALIIQDHPGKQLDMGSSWFDCLKKSQAKYLEDQDVTSQQTADSQPSEF